MSRRTIALFLTSLALAGGSVSCAHSPESGEKGDDHERPAMGQPPKSSPADHQGGEGGEGGEG